MCVLQNITRMFHLFALFLYIEGENLLWGFFVLFGLFFFSSSFFVYFPNQSCCSPNSVEIRNFLYCCSGFVGLGTGREFCLRNLELDLP